MWPNQFFWDLENSFQLPPESETLVMKITNKLICGYLSIVLVMSAAGYLSIQIYSDVKSKVVDLKANQIAVFGSSDELLKALEDSTKAIQTLIDHENKIIYAYPASPTPHIISREFETNQQVKIRLKSDLVRIENILAPLIRISGTETPSMANPAPDISEKALKDWIDLRKKHFYYHWKYLSHFINLANELPDQAYSFFKKTLEPHYINNIYPIIDRYREGEKKAKEQQVREIVDNFIPNASAIVITSTLATLVFVFFLGFMLSHSISGSLKKLTDAAAEIGRGQLTTHIDIKSNDEIGVLAHTFNRMVSDLSRSMVSKSYVDNIIKSMLDTLIVLDPAGSVRKVNRSTLNLLGYSRQELIGRSFRKIIWEGLSEVSVIDDLIYRGSIANVEKTYLTRGGEAIPMLFSGAVMHGDNGEMEGMVCVARDIIDRKRTETALRKAYGDMEKRVEERTVELSTANAQLKMEIEEHRRTEKALRKSENRLRQLSSHILTAQEKERKRVSLELHDDLGQSLSLLKVQLSSIQRKQGAPETEIHHKIIETQEYLDFIIENVRRLSRDLSPSILEDLGLTAAIEWLINDFTRHHHIRTRQDIHDINAFFSRESQIIIYRIFQEILSNISKHSGADHVSVEINKKGGDIAFKVWDSGVGFNVDEITAKSTTEKGIGLAAMQERALMLGAALEIASGENRGTQIAFTVQRNRGNSQQ